jgi:putative endonuclease
MNYYVYVLFSSTKNIFYKGLTDDINRRILEHNSGKCQSTKSLVPLELVFVQICKDRLEAREMEKYLKSGIGRESIKEIIG